MFVCHRCKDTDADHLTDRKDEPDTTHQEAETTFMKSERDTKIQERNEYLNNKGYVFFDDEELEEGEVTIISTDCKLLENIPEPITSSHLLPVWHVLLLVFVYTR